MVTVYFGNFMCHILYLKKKHMIREGNLNNMKYANFIVGNLLNLLGIKK